MYEPLNYKPHMIYVRDSWRGMWVHVPYLYASGFTIAAAPSPQSANLYYSYGRITRPPGLGDPVTYTPPNLIDTYIKVVVEDGPTWYGVCVDSEDQRDGVRRNAFVLTGTMKYACRGLEYLLQRDPITTSIVKHGDGEQVIERAIGFNLGSGLPSSAYREGNAHAEPGAEGTRIFTDDLQNSQEWTAADILIYLIAYHFPRDAAGDDRLQWRYDANDVRKYLGAYKPTLQIHGKTVWQVLNELIDRRRLLGFFIYVDPEDEVPEIRIFSFAREDITLPSGGDPDRIVANENQILWAFDSSPLYQSCTLATDAATWFDRIVVRGEPPGSVFTVEMAGGGGNNLLREGWTPSQQTEYNNGAALEATYPDEDDPLGRHNANQTARTKDHLKKVYAYYDLNPTSFTGMIGESAVWPVDAEHTADNIPFWLPGIRLQERLPLRLEHDYEVVDTVSNALKEKSKWEYQRPFAYFKDNETNRYFFADRSGRGEEVSTSLQSSGRTWACNLRMQDDAPGIVLTVAGAPQHVIAKNTFLFADPDDEADWAPDIDMTYLAATVFAEGDGNVTVTYPPDPMPIDLDTIKTLNIFLPNCRRDYIVPNTVIDINADNTLKRSDGGFVQDDTPYMLDVAASAYSWYRTTRKAMQITVQSLAWQTADSVTVLNTQENVYPGRLLVAIGSGNNQVEINSVVTSYALDLRAGSSTFTTGYAELDRQ